MPVAALYHASKLSLPFQQRLGEQCPGANRAQQYLKLKKSGVADVLSHNKLVPIDTLWCLYQARVALVAEDTQ